ncbi:MAG: hypothetical protein QOD77_725 [Thermoplasmata archaeon]|jgi:PAS domain S-box-containing protein|nr:hypothetical protein [Thermoplasmata archaeon]
MGTAGAGREPPEQDVRRLLRVAAKEDGSGPRRAAAEDAIAGMVSGLVETSAFLANILESSTEHSIIAKDLERRILSWNAGARRNYGYAPDEVLGKSSDLLHSPEDLEEGVVKRLHDEALAHGHAEGKFRRRRKDGTTFLASVVITRRDDAHGRPIGYLLVSRDITAEERLRREADENRRLLANILESSTQYSIIAEDLERRILSWNAGARRNYGYTADEVLGKSSDLLHDDQDLRTGVVGRMHATALRDGYAEGVFHRRRKDGSSFQASVVLTRRDDAHGKPLGYLLVSRDVTEELALRQEAEERHRRLAEADRRKDEFLATLAHELRNPLSPLAMASELLKREPDPAKQAHYHDILDRQVAHLTRLVDDLLDVARFSRGKIQVRREPMPLAAAVLQGAEIAGPLMQEKAQAFKLRGAAAPLLVAGDAVRLAQVFGNLLRNAAKYTPAGGRIEATVEAEGGEAVVRIADNGLGIPADRLASIFDPFVQAHAGQGGGGLGIGLTLAKSIVELHDGTVVASSAGENQGSTFTVRLPLLTVPAAGEPAAPPRTDATPARRVLVVDDNPDVGETLADLLRLEGHTVQAATSGQEGLAKARSLRPDIIFCDLGMPGMDGHEVARRVRADPSLAGCTLVALSGYATDADRARSMRQGFDHHLAKPPLAADLLALVRRAPRLA